MRYRLPHSQSGKPRSSMAGNHVCFTLIWLFLGVAGVCSKLLLVKTPVNPDVNQTVSLNCSGVFGTTMVKRLCDGQPLPDYNKEEDGYGRVYYFPPSEDRAGIFSCENFLGDRVSIVSSIFPPNAGIFSPSFSVTAHDGDDVTLTMDVPEDSLLHTANVSWRLYQHGSNCGGRLLPDQNQTRITRQNVTKQKYGGIYEMSLPDDQEGNQRALVQLLVTDCPAMLWGPGCSEPCPSCQNGGVCGEDGLCVCPPGFSGDVCQTGCGRNRYGYDCENNCGGNCTDMLFCLLPPYGCSCGTGLQGRNCERECASGTYGAGCSQSCGRCEDGASCDPYTGACPDERCEAGWEGTTCKQQIITEGKNNAFLIAVGVSACTLVLVGSLLWFYLRTTSKCAPKICGPDFDLSTVRGISDLAQTRSLYTVESFLTDDLHLKARSKFGDLEIDRAILKIDTNAIGSGAFGKVYKATVTEGTASSRLPKNVVAVKCLKDNATSQQKADFLEEIEHMVEVGSHPNILQLHGCCTAEQPIYMVVEYMQHGDLLGFLRRCKQVRTLC
ncbi:uncharacterized protein [Branchiostoma lanceolatum]|uniref:uncharacterized protein n=1 Tax=Branchiostoma lanceolatum TaxID=7740 RepID=UPI003453AA43